MPHGCAQGGSLCLSALESTRRGQCRNLRVRDRHQFGMWKLTGGLPVLTAPLSRTLAAEAISHCAESFSC